MAKNLQNILNAAKSQKHSEEFHDERGLETAKRIQESIRSADIDSLDRLVFGEVDESALESLRYTTMPNGEKHEIYDAQREADALKEGKLIINNKNSKMPSAILESIMQNPLIMTPIDEGESVMNEQQQNRAQDIISKLDARDAQARNYSGEQNVITESYHAEENKPQTSIDVKALEQIIESVIDRKFNEYNKQILNESRVAKTAPKVGLMTLGDNFKFMDEEGNVYECSMKYIGKGKVNKK